MRRPLPDEEYVTVVNNKGREQIQHVEYFVTDILGEVVYVTVNGLAYAQDSFFMFNKAGKLKGITLQYPLRSNILLQATSDVTLVCNFL